MPVEFGFWRIDSGINPVSFGTMDLESRLEEILDKDISIASPNWMIIGRQVHTEWDGRIDLLAIDQQGNLIVIELKRNKTPRDILAQALDYGSWVRMLKSDGIAKIYSEYRAKYQDGDRTRAWLSEPTTTTVSVSDDDKRGEWNGGVLRVIQR